MTSPDTRTDTARELYLDLLMRTITGAVSEDNNRILGAVPTSGSPLAPKNIADNVGRLVGRLGFEIAYKKPYDPKLRAIGRDWPARADSMIGLARMGNIKHCVETVIQDDVPGDLIETGVWRGGACIFMRGVLKAYDDTSRKVWVADSFQGLPAPDAARYPADAGDELHKQDQLAIGVDIVRHNFERYGLLDDQVEFLVGWFKDTLPVAPIEKVAVMRLDGDMYESTIQGIEALYPKLSPGGFCILDDYGSHMSQCGRAIHDYRDANGITDEIIDVDGFGAYWRKSG
ncbi:MAG TPA: TylF/MycF family methyltransferase [Solirubrobacteraceae bacterium]